MAEKFLVETSARHVHLTAEHIEAHGQAGALGAADGQQCALQIEQYRLFSHSSHFLWKKPAESSAGLSLFIKLPP